MTRQQNMLMRTLSLSLAVFAAVGFAAPPDEPSSAPAKKPAKVKKPIKMDEPMPIGMKREGMMKGDVKKSAEKKEAEMKPMMEQEEQAMPRGGAKK